MKKLVEEYRRITEQLDALPPADLRGVPLARRRKELQAIFKAKGMRPPLRHEVRV